MPETLVSIVIPTHARPDWLATALASAREVRWEPLEIIVCDDGGLDATADVVAAAAGDARVRLLVAEARGIAVNHRRAFEAARGEFVVVLSDDDRITPDFVARRAERLLDDPGSVVAFSGYRVCDDALQPLRDFDPPLPSDRPLDGDELVDAALRRAWSINGSMYRTAAVRAAWPDETAVGAAFDLALHLQLALAPGARGWYGHWCDVDYRLHGGQTSRGEAALRHFEAAARMYAHVLEQPMSESARARITHDSVHWYLQWGRALASSGDIAGARRVVRRAVRTAPRELFAWRALAAAYVVPSRLSRTVET